MQYLRLAVLATCIAAPATATTLVDGGFEAKGADTPVTAYCYPFASAGGPACATSPWVGGGVILSGNGSWGFVSAAEGSYYGFIQVTNSITQSFVATGNGSATVNWLDTNRAGYGGLQSYDVWIDQGMTSQLIGNYTTAVGGWVSRTSSSFALINGQNYTLRFTGLATSDSTAFIDSVALNVTPSAAVPEPASWAMLIAGFGLVGAAARRRRTALTA
jgi:hypothetical protein